MVEEPNKYGRLDIEDLLYFEADNEIRLPEDYRNFLIKYNGGRPVKNYFESDGVATDVNWLFGICHEPIWANLLATIDTFCERIPRMYLPIGKDSVGNLFIMSLGSENSGVIAFWDHENEAMFHKADPRDYYDNMKWVANSFEEFIEQLK